MAEAQDHIAAIRAALEIKSADGSLRSLFEERKTFIDACHPEAMRAILAHIEALEADAERYRWLRRGEYPIDFARNVLNDTPFGIDAAIDAARKEADRG